MANPQITVTVNTDGTVKTGHTVRTDTTPFVNKAKRIVDLTDVDYANSEFVEGATLVYDMATQKFTIQRMGEESVLPFDTVDGGLF